MTGVIWSAVRRWWRDGAARLNFYKHQGLALREVCGRHPDYLAWILKKDFADDVKEIIKQALNGNYPTETIIIDDHDDG